ncbi:ABC transporter ATP-binding protein [Nonomuraea sp. NPDC049400]|uniref:ABC transporter ATP-binding protein n=1 Tax=Nonomuraea sp. NPDC049400 TaxID=3364352 RepID=UPI00379D32EA
MTRRHTLRTLLVLAWRTDRRAALILAAFLTLGAVSQSLAGLFLRELTDTATAGQATTAVLWGLAAGSALAAGVALGRAELALMQELAERMGLAVQQEILTLTAGVPTIEHLERPAYLDKLQMLRQESWQLYFAVWAIALVVEHSAQIALGVALMAAVHPLLPLVLGGAVLPSLLVRGRAARHLDAATENTAETTRLEQVLTESATSAETTKEVRLSRAAPVLDTMAARHWQETSTELSQARIRAALLTFTGAAVFLAGYVAALGYTAWLAHQRQATAGDLVLVATVGVQFVTQASRLAFHLGSVAAGLRAADRLAWLRAYARTHAPAPTTTTAEPPQRLARGITLHQVSFAYPGTDRPVLHDLDLHLSAATTVALVGSHGSGKTTLAKLLCGLYRPTAGYILLDDVPLHALASERWRRRISAVFQDLARFELTAAETVGVGDLPRLHDPMAMDAALRLAGGTELVAGLPSGPATQLGDTFERGVKLSGGQWQKLALARASMRDAPLLLVLDEPTASLDAPAEAATFARYAEVLITHRFPTVRMADVIVVLEAGRIVQHGSHDDLIARPGPYAELYAIQQAAFTDRAG